MKVFMDYTVLTTHTINAPLVNSFKLDRGIITEAGIFFPPGCHGRVYAKLFFQNHQILPRTQESWCHGNAGWWSSETNVEVVDAPEVIKIIAYADATLYNHTITVVVELAPFASMPRWDKVEEIANAIEEALG